MSDPSADSPALQRRAQQGDGSALDSLIARHLEWVRACVRRRLGGVHRRDGDTMDYVQEALSKVLRYGPELTVDDDRQFRAIVAKIVENHLHDRFHHLTAEMRDVRREVGDSQLGVPRSLAGGSETPSRDAVAREDSSRLELALELLGHRDRIALRLRHDHGLPFARIGAALGVNEVAARKRHDRALVRMRQLHDDLEAGRIDVALTRSIGSRVRKLVESKLRAFERDALGGLARTAAGEETLAEERSVAEVVDAIRAAVREVTAQADEREYASAIVAAVRAVGERFDAAEPFVAIAAELERVVVDE